MTSWRPMPSEPDPLRAALHDYIRSRAAQAYLTPREAKQTLGRAIATLSDGRSLTIDLALMPAEIIRFAGREAIAYLLMGQAAEAGTDYQIEGKVVIDRLSLAFLQIDVTPTVLQRR
jgi:hypothetical protein